MRRFQRRFTAPYWRRDPWHASVASLPQSLSNGMRPGHVRHPTCRTRPGCMVSPSSLQWASAVAYLFVNSTSSRNLLQRLHVIVYTDLTATHRWHNTGKHTIGCKQAIHGHVIILIVVFLRQSIDVNRLTLYNIITFFGKGIAADGGKPYSSTAFVQQRALREKGKQWQAHISLHGRILPTCRALSASSCSSAPGASGGPSSPDGSPIRRTAWA